MRVLHFYKTSLPDTMGGVERVIDELARGARHYGVKSEVLSLTPHQVPRTQDYQGYVTHRAKTNFHVASTSFSASSLLRFTQLIKNVDIIHYHFPWPFMDLVHFAARVKKPTIVTYHSDIVRQKFLLQFYRPLKLFFLNDVDEIVATSPNYLATSDVLARFKRKVKVIPIGLDKQSYPEPSSARIAYWKAKLGNRFFLFVGVLRYYKGLHILIEAAQSSPCPVVIVGAGPTENELKEQVLRLGLKNVVFLGFLSDDDKVALLKLCFAIVFPSHLRSEAFGISLLEGAMYGKPMISSEIGTGTSFINIHNETGLVVKPGDSDALRQAMLQLWSNPEMACLMGEKAQQRFQKYFTADEMVRDYVALYKQLLNKVKDDKN